MQKANPCTTGCFDASLSKNLLIVHPRDVLISKERLVDKNKHPVRTEYIPPSEENVAAARNFVSGVVKLYVLVA